MGSARNFEQPPQSPDASAAALQSPGASSAAAMPSQSADY